MPSPILTPYPFPPTHQHATACNAWSSEGNTFAKFNLLDSISLSNLGITWSPIQCPMRPSLIFPCYKLTLPHPIIISPSVNPPLVLLFPFLTWYPLSPPPFRFWHLGAWSCRFGLFWISRRNHLLHQLRRRHLSRKIRGSLWSIGSIVDPIWGLFLSRRQRGWLPHVVYYLMWLC